MPKLSGEEVVKIEREIATLSNPYIFLKSIDPNMAFKIHPNDTYRTHKALEIFYATCTPPSEYFKANPKNPLSMLSPYSLCLLKKARSITISNGAPKTCSIQGLLKKSKPSILNTLKISQPFKAIGVKESVLFLEKRLTLKELEEAITSNTMKLAKRQNTFNKTQFNNLYVGALKKLGMRF